jgi:hypothetical protein
MPTSSEFEAALETTAEYVRGIGDEISDKSVENVLSATERGEEYSLTGHRCIGDDDSLYIVAGHPELRHLYVVFALSVKQNVGSQLDDELVAALIEDEDDLDETEKMTKAGEILLERLPQEETEALKTYTFMFLTSSPSTGAIHTNEEGTFEYYSVENLIFPYEEEFGIKDFNDAVQSTVTNGRRGSRLLGRTIFVDRDEENLSNTELQLHFGW